MLKSAFLISSCVGHACLATNINLGRIIAFAIAALCCHVRTDDHRGGYRGYGHPNEQYK
ncbi:hypothetical protein PF005_g9636 [Phytophthora fragariae]|uniref:Uncharacterized protein n=1 Tax=Phytophthora fragariae TaxID=53985 RepID=A0A6A3ST19_9STRA|nr:hypothetical protein PF003_g22134 [Phytophthora fragariae]KAE8939440.1 hypothetical protein PF009_g10715 [Phytophthora fragariae]KAE9016309.1 hypothetical protein PF011_g7209 [Phytophthora fragariae]KAE9116140.1 hypothetical protein PF007_g9769 [Phytophthora fragariae]KAE9116288.1 hypothetical protein PF010_g9018 [Phytophthora fragariae]